MSFCMLALDIIGQACPEFRMFANLVKRLIVVLFVSGVAVAGTGYWYFQEALSKPLTFGESIFTIKRGDTLSGISELLLQKGIIREPWSLRLLGRQQGNSNAIKAGEYELPETLTLREFYDRIVAGKGQVDMRVTIVEGWTFKLMRQALDGADKLVHLTSGLRDEEVMQQLGYPGQHPEGRFYPDTYYYRSGDSDLNILKKAYSLMQKKLDEAWAQRTPEMLLDSPYEALILASIIEKETQLRDEQPEIAGVLMNRLKKGMRLQTDSTVIYGIGDAYNGDITRKHLKTDTPYNTYTRGGLIPTPISLPGEGSLLATVKPATTRNYYFVAKGGGRHHFSRTLKEHNAAVQKYIFGK
uniref:Endolytic murein transglycosylase n=1 Tax=uncultured bacterium B19D1_C12D4_E9D6 TaxID=1329637 RepID=S4W434_9BACT|nr:protein YceG-like protein [uncultured bacterium B19D1_C12D4_E9D6]